MLEGTLDSKILIISDIMRARETASGRILEGERRDIIENSMSSAGILKSDYAITILGPNCKETILNSKANILVPLGSKALKFLTGMDNINKYHLSLLTSYAEFGGRKVMGLLHPEAIQKSYADIAYVRWGAKKLKQEMLTPSLNIPVRNIKTSLDLSFPEIVSYLEDVVLKAPEVSTDIETDYHGVNCCGFAVSPTEAIAIESRPDKWKPIEFHKLWDLYRQIWESQNIGKIAQNALFEMWWASVYGIEMDNVSFDTMLAMKYLHPTLERGLDNVGRLYTPYPYWKDGLGDWSNISNWRNHLEYNCLMQGTPVITDKGNIPIDHIVNKKMKVNVLSFNEKSRKLEWKPVIKFLKKRHKEKIKWVQVKTNAPIKGRGMVLTPDHKVYTQEGWIEAKDLRVGQNVMIKQHRLCVKNLLGTILGDSSFGYNKNKTSAYVQCGQINKELILMKQRIFGGVVTGPHIKTGDGDFKNKKPIYSLYIPCSMQIKNLADRMIFKGKKRAKYLEMISHLGMALLIMDDGYKAKRGKKYSMMIATQGFCKEDQDDMAASFSKRYGHVSVTKQGSLSFSIEASKTLCEEIGKFIIPSMRYKLSHDAPDFDENSIPYHKEENNFIPCKITEINHNYTSKKGGTKRSSYCLTIKDNSNFMTTWGLVANCKDTTGTFMAKDNMEKALKSRGMFSNFRDFIMPQVHIAHQAQTRGFRLDQDMLETMKHNANRDLESIEESFNRQCKERIGREININSPKQVREALREIGIKIPTSKGKETVSRAALMKLKNKNPKEMIIRDLIKINELKKKTDEYLNFEADPDGRVRFSMDLASDENGLWVGKKSIFNRGFDATSVPQVVKNCIIADEGKTFVQIRLNQPELRFIAKDAPDYKLQTMLNEYKDVNRFMASKIFRKPEGICSRNEIKIAEQVIKSANEFDAPKMFVERCFAKTGVFYTDAEAKRLMQMFLEEFEGCRKRIDRIRKEMYSKRMLQSETRQITYYDRVNDSLVRRALSWGPETYSSDQISKICLAYKEHELVTRNHNSLLLQVDDSYSFLEGVFDNTEIKIGSRWGSLENV